MQFNNIIIALFAATTTSLAAPSPNEVLIDREASVNQALSVAKFASTQASCNPLKCITVIVDAVCIVPAIAAGDVKKLVGCVDGDADEVSSTHADAPRDYLIGVSWLSALAPPASLSSRVS
ncbi:hypothetical protein SCAR479_12673 [Seiridium cardinale]|uniref:Fungal calcium binding protein domain-containing protein n=1 Tax=Seiridium cardinale TaxID=138064 RepID=A0ABR2XA68_9PEZI